MKFSCNKCETKYSIADEKVRGKVLKIRCKKCENIIVLREPRAEEPKAEEPTRAVALDPNMLASLRASLPNQGPAQSNVPTATVAATPQPARQPPQRMQTGTGIPLSRGPAPAASPSSRNAGSAALAAAQPRQATPPPVEEWYLAIKGQQVGPMALRDVQTRIGQGDADERTYGWRDGMGDWKRLADIPEFRSFLTRPPPPPPPPVPPPPPAANNGAGAQVVDLQAEIARRKRGNAPQPQDDPEQALSAMSVAVPVRQPTNLPRPQAQPEALASLLDEATTSDASHPLGGAPLGQGAGDPFGAVPDAAGNADGPPRESTRMFIAAAGLANRGRKHRIYAGVGALVTTMLGTVLYLDASGIYQIPIVSDIVSVGFAALDVEQPKARKERVVDEDGEGTDLSFLGIGKPKVHKARGTKGPTMPGGIDTSTGDLAEALKGAGNNAPGATFERKGDEAVGVGEPVSSTKDSMALKGLLAGDGRKHVDVLDPNAAKGGVKVTGQQEHKQVVETPLSPEQIGKVVIDQKTSLNQCANEAAKVGEKFKGTVKAVVLIGPSGKVKKVTVSDTKISNTRLGECLGRALMRWIFPRFQGEEFEAELPLKLTVGQ